MLSKPECTARRPSLAAATFAGGVEQRSLEAGQRRVGQRVFNGHLDREGRVRVYIGQGQQVGGAHKEVAVERVDGQTWRRRRVDASVRTAIKKPGGNAFGTARYLWCSGSS